MELDVVGLLETDLHVSLFGSVNQLMSVELRVAFSVLCLVIAICRLPMTCIFAIREES